jgi:UDP-N-acetylglucosamine 2-epimerase (non-hydrolysing)
LPRHGQRFGGTIGLEQGEHPDRGRHAVIGSSTKRSASDFAKRPEDEVADFGSEPPREADRDHPPSGASDTYGDPRTPYGPDREAQHPSKPPHFSTVAHIVGARPNFMKASPVLLALAAKGIEQRLVHTGQHYDEQMSDVFFRDLGLPQPDVNLGVGSGTQATQTAALMVALEPALLDLDPALVVVYGDVNSTLAAALVAAKLDIPVAHVEAGLRSFDDSMPEEINRRLTDQLSTLLFVTSPEGLTNLEREGVAHERIHFVGNPMIDTLLANLDRFDSSAIAAVLDVPDRYAVATLHRPANVDDPRQARRIVAMLVEVSRRLPVILPIHPRSRPTLQAAGLVTSAELRVVDPLGYVEFISLVRGAALVVTDSGGIQEETTVLGVPCLTVRPNTERPITITHGTNRLVEPESVAANVDSILDGGPGRVGDGPPLWDGHAGERIAVVIEAWMRDRPGLG